MIIDVRESLAEKVRVRQMEFWEKEIIGEESSK